VKLKILFCCAFFLGLGACGGGPRPLSGERLAVVAVPELPPPPAYRGDVGTGYALGPLDTVDIDVFGVEDLSRKEIQIDANGRIAFPLAGTVTVTGMTIDDLARALEDRLRGRYIRDPKVTVNLRKAVSQAVTVEGGVKEPGVYPAYRGMTLMRAIASANGETEFAKLNEVVIFRQVGSQSMAALYSLEAIRAGNYADPEIYPNDVVVVGDSPGRRMFTTLLQSAPALLASPIVALIQNN
jgi:polysaccharide export outer membrane protein